MKGIIIFRNNPKPDDENSKKNRPVAENSLVCTSFFFAFQFHNLILVEIPAIRSSPTLTHIRHKNESKIAKDNGKKLLNKSDRIPSLTPNPAGANKAIRPMVLAIANEPVMIGILDGVIKVTEFIKK